MKALAHVMDTMTPDLHRAATRTSTLYDLIAAISDEAEPGEEGLILEAVLGLMKSGKIKWVHGHRDRRRIR